MSQGCTLNSLGWRRVWLAVVMIAGCSWFSGCSSARTQLAQCQTSRQELLSELEALRRRNELLAMENRSRGHRLAEAEKRMAR